MEPKTKVIRSWKPSKTAFTATPEYNQFWLLCNCPYCIPQPKKRKRK